ncbi:hypothetical protein AYO22_08460 [Fonsecaea multimorphosa]|nr:hypothetical protein AYO22_08460 [Fonsecaea multimorphosa]
MVDTNQIFLAGYRKMTLLAVGIDDRRDVGDCLIKTETDFVRGVLLAVVDGISLTDALDHLLSRRSRSRSSRGDSVPEEHERPETGRPQNGQTFNYEEVMKWLIREKPEPNLPGLDHEACKKFITVCSGIADDLEKEISVIRRTVATFIESRPEIRGSRFLLHAFWLPVLHVLAVDPPAQRSVKGMHLFTWPNVELQYWRGRELFAEEYPQVVQAMNW